MPLTVCEVLRDLPAAEGKTIPILGRYSFRERGRWVGQQTCEPPLGTDGNPGPQLILVEDSKDGPKLPEDFELDGAALRTKLQAMLKHTALGKFRFGSTDYDRWAVIYGRVEARKGEDAKKAAANLIYRGDAVIVTLSLERYLP